MTLIGAPFTGSALGLLLLIVVLTVSTVAAVKRKRIILKDDGQNQCHKWSQQGTMNIHVLQNTESKRIRILPENC